MATVSDPIHHTRKMRAELQQIVEHLRADITLVDEPQFKAMFETSAEVLQGIIKTLEDYEKKEEPAWRAA